MQECHVLTCNKFSDLSIWSQTLGVWRGHYIVTLCLISFSSQIWGREREKEVPLDRPARQMDRGAFHFSSMIPSTIAWNSLWRKRKDNKNLMWGKFSDNNCLVSLHRLILLGAFIFWYSLHPSWLWSLLMKALRQIAVPKYLWKSLWTSLWRPWALKIQNGVRFLQLQNNNSYSPFPQTLSKSWVWDYNEKFRVIEVSYFVFVWMRTAWNLAYLAFWLNS